MSTTTVEEPRQIATISAKTARTIMFAFVAYAVFFNVFPNLARLYPFELMFYGADRPAPLADPFVDRTLNFCYGLMGAIMSGWFLTIAIAMRSGARVVWDAALIGLAVWFVLDNVTSLIYGYPLNIVTNTGFVAVLLPTLLLSRPAAA
ncbi:MAG: hypothetical protein AAFX52_11665 [Pseudomonadota bacterium]